MLVERLNNTHQAIFDALATFRYLTPDHMMLLGVTKNKGYLYDTLSKLIWANKKEKKLRKPAVLVELDYGVLPGKGRLSRLYALTRHGADLLEEAQGEGRNLTIPKRIVATPSDYFHRCGSIDFHVALELWAHSENVQIDFYKAYYEPRGNGSSKFAPVTRLKMDRGYLDADAFFAFTTSDGVKRLCAFEMCRGRRTKYVEDKLIAYMQACEKAVIENAFNYDHGARVLCVFEDARALELMQKRLAIEPTFDEYREIFFAKTLANVMEEFKEGWCHFDDEQVALY